ncbi:GlsB/YeaQ/YmgE family stress response membrane protein [Dyella telluris]|uniref:GlsB/YeaQ/YmgE family stress response membrane protein n=1 Tax=Dyella telluris TaxID=2763498 RepID=A0A7G8Q7W4_9GAMM|nr:GlsB/YeaQ/YmgE family stress response membrane protein [Dyella telluris]QNK02872.1 GlsB/YeaQ/YmgE family stress response membrane protein [Dyella telluris]
MHLVWTICIGFLAGVVARWISPGRHAFGFFLTAALGIAGAVLATYIGQALHWYAPGESSGFIGAIVGAIVLLALGRLLTRKS